MGLFEGFDISMSGMEAQARRLRLITSNLANAGSTRSADGEVYRRKDVVFAAVPLPPRAEAGEGSGIVGHKVVTAGVFEDPRPPRRVHMPEHPDADEQGFVEYPNVEPIEEMVHMMDAVRTYEANITGFNATKEMIRKAIDIGR